MIAAERPYRIVSIGGGTGLSVLLAGLKRFVRPESAPAIDIRAVVTVTDDGGSSGRLRREFDMLPPGDIRNCMVALSEDEALMSRLFQFRFKSGRGLKGHSFGNLFLTALTHITGDFQEAIKLSSEVLKIGGAIYPSTSADVVLEAELVDGTRIAGETKISRSKARINRIRLRPRNCKPLPETLEAIREADLITLGPGSLFTSVVPNLLVEGIPEAIRRSPAVKAYFVNLMWQPGETMSFTASDHVKAIHRHAGDNFIDYALVNIRAMPKPLRRRYARTSAMPVDVDLDELKRLGLEVVAGNLLQEGEMARHNPDAIASLAVQLAKEGRLRRELAATEAQRSRWRKRG